MNKLNKLQQPTSGGALLLLVIIITLVTSIISLALFRSLSTYTTINANTTKSESSYQLASKILRDSISKHLAPAPFPEWPTFDENNQYTENFNNNGTKFTQIITKDPITNSISFEIIAEINGNPRKLKATLAPPIIQTNPIDIVLLFDTSTSMNRRVAPNDPSNMQTKMEAAKIAAKSFLDQFAVADNTRIAIVTYSTSTDILRPLSLVSSESEINATKSLIDTFTPNGSTNIGDSLKDSNNILNFPYEESTSPKRYVVLLTDGQPTVTYQSGSPIVCSSLLTSEDKEECVQSAKNYSMQQANLVKTNRKATIYSIGLGDNADSQSLDSQLLKNLASSETEYFETPDSDQLTVIYQNIAQAILTGGTLQYREVLP